MTDLQKKVLNKLLDQYEKGRELSRIKITPKRVYSDWDSRYFDIEKRSSFLDEMKCLEAMDVVSVEVDARTGYIKSISIVPDKIQHIFQLLRRKESVVKEAEDVTFIGSLSASSTLGKEYVDRLKERVKAGETIDHELCKKLIAFLDFVAENKKEIFERELSQLIFSDTKIIEKKYRSTISDLLYSFEQPFQNTEMETSEEDDETSALIMERYGILRTPVPCFIKGEGVIKMTDGREIIMYPDIVTTITSDMLTRIRQIVLKTRRVVTIENLTPFFRMKPTNEEAVVYLGGYHNRAKQLLLKKIYQDNQLIDEWMHAGDLDPNGIQILFNLREKTGIQFEPLFMDPDLIGRYAKYTKPITDMDIRLAKKLKVEGKMPALIDKMLATGRTLEQEIIFLDMYGT